MDVVGGPPHPPRPRAEDEVPAPSTPGTDATSTERALLVAAALGDAGAWQVLVEHHAEQVWRVPREAGLDAARAGVVSELTWTRLAEALPDVPAGGLSSWLQVVATTETERALGRAAHLDGLPWDGRERRHSSRTRA